MLLLSIFFINGLIYIPRQSVTYDEANHYLYASRFVKGKPEKIKTYDDASAMPISSLNTIPRIVEQLFNRSLQKFDDGREDIYNGRYITLLISLFIGFYVYKWSKDLYGDKAGLLSLFLFSFCPNISAHANLVTTDAYSALFTIAPLYHFHKYIKKEQIKDLVWFAVLLAVAQLSKQSLTYLYPLFIILAIIASFNKLGGNIFKVRNLTKTVLLVIVIQLAIINLGFQFNHTGMALNNYEFKSQFFNNVKRGTGYVKYIFLPLPAPYLYGLDYSKTMDEWGGGTRQTPYSYLLGELRARQGFSYYYLVVCFFKIPVATMIFIVVSMILLIKNRPGSPLFTSEFPIIFTIIYFLAYFSLFYNSQVGIRHIILILPLLFVLCGMAAKILFQERAGRIFIFANCLYGLVSFYYFFPHLISYTNEFIVDKKMAYKIFADSNLEYGDGKLYLQRFLKEHPSIEYAPLKPSAGQFIIATNDFLNVRANGKYEWLHKNFNPVDHFIFEYLIFNISETELINKGLNR